MDVKGLRPPLLLHALFSGTNGLLLVLDLAGVATWLGPQTNWVDEFLGLGLILFALALGFVAIHPKPLVVLAVTAADLAWLISTTAALVVWRHDFTILGWSMVLGTNAVVLTLAWLQLRSIRNAFRVSDGSPVEYELCIAVAAPVAADAFWKVLADLGGIQRYMPALKSSALTVGKKAGVGCVRTCENVKGQIWSEKCEAWEEGQSVTLAFQTDVPGFPFPFSRMRGGWRVAPQAAGCQVQVWWRVVPRRTWAAPLLLPLMAAGVQRDFAGVVARMARAAQGSAADSATLPAFARLPVVPC